MSKLEVFARKGYFDSSLKSRQNTFQLYNDQCGRDYIEVGKTLLNLAGLYNNSGDFDMISMNSFTEALKKKCFVRIQMLVMCVFPKS